MKQEDFPIEISPERRTQIIVLAEAFAAWKSKLYKEQGISIVRIDPSAWDDYIEKVCAVCEEQDIRPGVCALWHVLGGSSVYNDPERCLVYHDIICYDFPGPEYSVVAFMQEIFARVGVAIPEELTHLPDEAENS